MFNTIAQLCARELIFVLAFFAMTSVVVFSPQARAAAFLWSVLTVLSVWGLTLGLEYVIGRKRPYVAHGSKPLGKFWTPTSSFPSAHSALAGCLASIIAFHHVILGGFAIFVAFLVALARVYVRVHYFSDVVVGVFIGFLWGFFWYHGG